VKCKPWDQKLISERLCGSQKNCLSLLQESSAGKFS
jgi:hypothetical protein